MNDFSSIIATQYEIEATVKLYDAACMRGNDKEINALYDKAEALFASILMQRREAIEKIVKEIHKK